MRRWQMFCAVFALIVYMLLSPSLAAVAVAHEYAKTRRDIANPNPGFIYQLISFDRWRAAGASAPCKLFRMQPPDIRGT